MNKSNGIVKASYEKRLNFTATCVLVIWIIFIIFGIYSLINEVQLSKMPEFWPYSSWSNSFGIIIVLAYYFVFIIGFFPSKSISISLIELIKNKRWIEPLKLIKGIVIQSVITAITAILTIIVYDVNTITDFFSLFFSFTFLFSIEFLILVLYYYYRYDLPERQTFRNPSQRGHI